MNTQQTILHALKGVIDPTVHEAEVRAHEQGHACCWVSTVRAGAARAPQFAANLAERVAQANRIAAMRERHGARDGYHEYLSERLRDAQGVVFLALSGDAEMVTAMGHDIVPVQEVLVQLMK